jgi:hypothetical protein
MCSLAKFNFHVQSTYSISTARYGIFQSLLYKLLGRYLQLLNSSFSIIPQSILSMLSSSYLFSYCIMYLKVVGNEKVGGVAKVAYDRYWSRTVVIDVRFYFYLAAILDLNLFPFLLTPAQ